MVDDIESKQTPELTQTKTLSVADEVGNNLRAIKETYPHTSNALSLHSRLFEDQIMNDPRALDVKTIVMDYEYGNEQNAINLTTHVFEGDEFTKPEDIYTGLVMLRGMTSSTHPDDLYSHVKSQMTIVRERLLSDKLRSGVKEDLRSAMRQPENYKGEIRQLLIAYQDFDLASQELIPNLTKKPSEL